MARHEQMRAVAVAAVARDLERNGSACATPEVGVTIQSMAATEAVTVTVTCTVAADGTEPLRLSPRTVSASSTEIVDRYRAR